MTPNSKSTRRRFLAADVGRFGQRLAIPHLIPASALGLGESVAPGNRITVGMIGVGRQVLAYNLPFFVSQPDCEVVALCDVDRWRLEVTEERTASPTTARRRTAARRFPSARGMSISARCSTARTSTR